MTESNSELERQKLKLRHALESCPLSGKEIAQRLGVSAGAVSMWRSGQNYPERSRERAVWSLLKAERRRLIKDESFGGVSEPLAYYRQPDRGGDMVASLVPSDPIDRARDNCHGLLDRALDEAGEDLARVHWVQETLRQTFRPGRFDRDDEGEG